MIQELSVLIPTYNCNCVDLVKSLHWQLDRQNISYEIIVADDCSTEKEFVEQNKVIEKLDGVNYIILEKNIGRAAIRNYMADQAQHEWLLFIDGDTTIDRARYIEIYLEQENADVVVGGIAVDNIEKKWHHNLRYRYETKVRKRIRDSRNKKKSKDQEFRSTNFMIKKEVYMENPFNEDFKQYGYEDVLFGKELKEKGYTIKNIRNRVIIGDFEDNPTFVAKTEEAMRTLHEFRNELSGCSGILKYRWLKPLLLPCYYLFGKIIRRNLAGNNPQLPLFNIYKLLYYSKL